jgi:very-short-patch-repair endonuclease
MRKKYDWKEIQELYDSGLSMRDIVKNKGVSMRGLVKAVRRGDLITRSLSDSMKLAVSQGKHNIGLLAKSPQNREAAKQRMLNRIAKDPNNHPNRKLAGNRKNMSFPERLVFDLFIDKKINFEHNKYIKPFWPDFVIENKLIIEIDGERWHDKEKDFQKDIFFHSHGYRVVRIPAKEVLKNPLIVLNFIGDEEDSESATFGT